MFPNIKAILPNHMSFKYYEPVEVGPQHMPDKLKNPGKWKYYDVDLDAVRAQIFQNIYFSGKDTDKEGFEEMEKFFKLLQAY